MLNNSIVSGVYCCFVDLLFACHGHIQKSYQNDILVLSFENYRIVTFHVQFRLYSLLFQREFVYLNDDIKDACCLHPYVISSLILNNSVD